MIRAELPKESDPKKAAEISARIDNLSVEDVSKLAADHEFDAKKMAAAVMKMVSSEPVKK